MGAVGEFGVLVGGDDRTVRSYAFESQTAFILAAASSLAFRLLDGEPEGFGIFAVEPPRVHLRRREELVLQIHQRARARRADNGSPTTTLPSPAAAHGVLPTVGRSNMADTPGCVWASP